MGSDVLPPQRDTFLLAFHWPEQVSWPHLSCKGWESTWKANRKSVQTAPWAPHLRSVRWETSGCEKEGRKGTLRQRTALAEHVFWKSTLFSLTLPPTLRKAFLYLQQSLCPSVESVHGCLCKTFPDPVNSGASPGSLPSLLLPGQYPFGSY